MRIILISIFAVFCLSGMGVSVDPNLKFTSSYFDGKGTITRVLSPSSLVIDNEVVKLEGVDPSGLYSSTYAYLTEDLRTWLIGNDVFIKGNYVFFDLNGAFNSISINQQIQEEINNLRYEQYYDCCYDWGYC
jgi:hypothetical protein